MPDYEPIDISAHCNAGVEVLPPVSAPGPATPPAEPLGPTDDSLDGQGPRIGGLRTFRGLPFLVGGADPASDSGCLVSLKGGVGPVTVPIGRTATRCIVAHRMLESELPDGGPLGIPVADYVFDVDGDKVVVPIRERFEIAAGQDFGPIPGVPGEPFLAVTDLEATLAPRYEGRWDEMQARQAESHQGQLKHFYLWSWTNPHMDRIVRSLTIVPRGPSFIVAALTLSHLDEEPFPRQRRREARIVLTDPADAEKPFDVDVDVDRGSATYVHPLPEASAEEFIEDTHKGWGEEQNVGSSPAYVEISATPSATVTVKSGSGPVGKVNWGEVQGKGEVATDKVRVQLMDRGKNWVHVTVVDDDTGEPIPCRVHFRSPEGIPYQPHGHHNHVNSNLASTHNDIGGDLRMGQITYAYIDGTCQGWLPRGDVIVDVARGFEYEPLRARVRIEPGQRELSLRLKRWTDMNAQGWYSGDSHVHFLSTQGAHLESSAEDLNVVNLLQSQWGSLFTSTEEFTGSPSLSRSGDNIVYVSQENRQHFLGHMSLWGLKRPVMPWCTDGPGEAELGGSMETTLSHWADEAHAQGGYVISPHFPVTNGEPATLIATGRLDAVEMLRRTSFNQNEYYRYLNCGYRLPLVGGTDKMSSDVPVGFFRTYARLRDGEEFTYESWCENVARGRTFLSGGPIISLSVDGHQVGDTVDLSGPGTVEVEAWAESTLPIDVLEIVQAGRVVASTEWSGGTRRLELRERLQIDGHTWLAARAGGSGLLRPHEEMRLRGVFAHTSPVYVACGGEWQMFDADTAQYMLTMIEGALAYVNETSTQAVAGTMTHHHGEPDHMAYLQRPFQDADRAVRRRMHELGMST